MVQLKLERWARYNLFKFIGEHLLCSEPNSPRFMKYESCASRKVKFRNSCCPKSVLRSTKMYKVRFIVSLRLVNILLNKFIAKREPTIQALA